MQDDYPSRMLMSAVLSLATPTHPKPEDLAVRTLLLSHHPSLGRYWFVRTISSYWNLVLWSFVCCGIISFFVVSSNPSSWQKVISKLNLVPGDLISQSSSHLLRTLLEGMTKQREACGNALGTLLTLGAKLIVPKIVDDLCELLGNTEVQGVTEEMVEIMYTPQGQLWHHHDDWGW